MKLESITELDEVQSKYENFLSAMMYSNITVGLRIQWINGQIGLNYLTEHDKSHVLMATFSSQFSGFEMIPNKEYHHPDIEGPVYIAVIQGIPKLTRDSLNGLVEATTQTQGQVIYQVWSTPAKPRFVTRKIIEKQYSSALGRTQIQDSSESWLRGRETTTRYDVAAIRDARRLEQAYQRMNAERLLDCRVILAVWGYENSRAQLEILLNTLRGTISLPDKKEQLKVKIYSDDKALRVLSKSLEMDSSIKGTLLLPRDAIPYYTIPTIEMGVIQDSSASFSTARTERVTQVAGAIPFRQDHVALGTVYRNGRLDTNQVKYIPIENLRRHVAVFGMTGSGKSTTKNRIVIDAWKNDIPSLILEPVKLDTRTLIAAIDEIRVFTVGREPVNPFRLNPFLIEEGVPVQGHIDRLYHSFLAAWPLYGILANHLRKVINYTYQYNGWNILTDKRGTPVSLQDFRDEAERYSRGLEYGSELSQDFKGAILTRVKDLCDPSRAAIFNTRTNLDVAELLRYPTIIELGHIKDPEFKALMLNLILYKIEEYLDKLGPADRLRSLILIDEAHRFLRELPMTLDMSEVAMSKRQAQDLLEDLTAEARGVGVGIIVLDQDPSQLSRRVIKNCHTKIIHRLESPDDVHLTALLTGCDEHQQAHISTMKEGETIVRGLGDTVPLNVQVFYDPQFIKDMKSNWSDEEVKEHMADFYTDHPEFAETPEIPILDPAEVIVDRELLALRVQVEDIVRSDGFRTNYYDCITGEDAEEVHALEELIIYYATRTIASGIPVAEVITVFLDTMKTVYGEPPYPLSESVLHQLLRACSQTDVIESRRDQLEP